MENRQLSPLFAVTKTPNVVTDTIAGFVTKKKNCVNNDWERLANFLVNLKLWPSRSVAFYLGGVKIEFVLGLLDYQLLLVCKKTSVECLNAKLLPALTSRHC